MPANLSLVRCFQLYPGLIHTFPTPPPPPTSSLPLCPHPLANNSSDKQVLKSIMIKLHVILCAVAVFGMGANATDPDPKKLILMADVGSGGTRLVVMVKTATGEVVQCCTDKEGKPEVCAEESDVIKSRFAEDTTIEKVTEFAGQLVEETFKNVRRAKDGTDAIFGNKPECMLYAKDIDAFKLHLKRANIALFATAGARRLEVKTPGCFKTVFLGGFKKYFATIDDLGDAAVTGAVLPG